MGYLDNRARDFKVYVNSHSFEGINPVSTDVDPKLIAKAKFRRILYAVIALGLVAAMQYTDENFFQRKVTVVQKDSIERVEPTFLEKMFCKGNRRPKFCR